MNSSVIEKEACGVGISDAEHEQQNIQDVEREHLEP